MTKPAARIGDSHSCPARTGKIPHVGGPIVKGSPNVFINGMPAARQGDTAVCVGPPDMITAGSSSVFINGLPAARLGDGTAHGGAVIGGSPDVMIGDSGYQSQTRAQPAPQQQESNTTEGISEQQLSQAASTNEPMTCLCSQET